ncbi:MAG: HAMP domain-containing sensor histidine kinase, partial [Bdellovibrionota bacterium]
SFMITSLAVMFSDTGNNANLKPKLEKLVPTLTPEFRKTGLGRLIEKPNRRNLEYVIKSEIEYRKFIHPTLSYIESRVYFYSAISLGVVAFIISVLLYYVLSRVFTPLQDLSTKMVDFINHRYTYQFTVPEPNEIGRLHATFNAMAQRVLQQIEDLKSLDKAKSEFLSIASHELRTPLTSIKGSLSLLRSGVVGQFNEAALNLMNIAVSETDRLIRIINEFLDLAKIEAKQFPLQLEWKPARELIHGTIKALEGFAGAAEVELAGQIENDFELHIDADRIQQVITNLASNAIKFSPKKGTVLLRVALNDNQQIVIEVTDQGRGIAPEDQELIFEKFRQATSASNPLVKGTGLGLAIAKALVEEHRGQIGVRSTPGHGSTFYFTIPQWRLRHVENNQTNKRPLAS